MRILQLHSENVKRLKVIDITPVDDVVIISGMNEQGKTSVIDCIWLALENRAASRNNPLPIRAGEDKALIMIDLGTYIVTRKFTSAGTTLEVRTPDGSKITSPQKLLDGLIGELSFDPWEFSRKREEEQRQMLADLLFTLTQGKLDMSAFERRREEAYAARTDANRERKRLATLVTQVTPPRGDEPADEIAAQDLINSINDALVLKKQIEDATARAADLQKCIEGLEQQLLAVRDHQAKTLKFLSEAPEIPNVALLQSELQNIQERNKRAREIQQYKTLVYGLEGVDKEIERLNETLELIEIEKADALEASPLPVKNLRITPDGLMVVADVDKLVPFCQASAAQKLRISLGIAMAANPTLRVIRIADGSLLDDLSMQIIRDMAKAQDFQVWVEYASRNDQDRMGVYIEDGSVA
jgi:DNA repair exonuclease SbcCD ATPase subunit